MYSRISHAVRWRTLTMKLSSAVPVLISMLAVLFTCSGVSAQTVPKEASADICYKCHVKVKEELSKPSVHFPFKQGKCYLCHNSHASNIKGLLNDDINDLCLGCHEKLKKQLKTSSVHSAIKNGSCTDCHTAHSSVHKDLLVKDEKNLCWDCHIAQKEQLKKASVHVPFRDGQCSACHGSHSSTFENQFKDQANKVCRSCHPPRCSAGGIAISYATKDMDCTSCHSGHAADAKKLLGPFGHSSFISKGCDQCHNPIVANRPITTKLAGKDLCFSCHKKDPSKYKDGDVHEGQTKNACLTCHKVHASKQKGLTTNEAGICEQCHDGTFKRISLMVKTFKKIRCTPVSNRKCFACHIPMHSSEKFYFKGDGITVCTKCHTTEHRSTHPLGKGVIDPRNGQIMTCVSCHSMHSAKSDYMLSFDRKRQLCIQCHKMQ